MWHQEANFISCKPAFVRSFGFNYGMPIESVSKILGHTDIATTQIYAKVTSTKLEHDISAFESRIKGHMPTMGGMA